MKLVIVESPHKAKTIAKYLGKEYHVLASAGHVSDLPQKSLGIDIDHGFAPQYVVTPGKEETIKRIKAELAKADKVYLATDPDREGEAISWHLKNVCDIKGGDIRIVFNEISKKAVLAALENPRAINMNLVDAQQARRVLDRLVGYQISPILSRKIKSGQSAGRVQSVALKMIVDREREIRDFKPEEYWNIYAFLLKDKRSAAFKCEFVDVDGKKYKVRTKETAEKIVARSKEGEWSVDQVKRSTSVSKPQPPFTTSTMQQDASAKLSMTASQVMQVAQQLYEGVDIPGMGQIALVTYIRTDSVRVAVEAQNEALDYIRATYGEKYAPKRPNVYTTKASAQDAHEAIRPISLAVSPESIKDKVQRNIYRLYKLIFDRFVASQMQSASYDTLNVHIISSKEGHTCGYTLKGRTLKFNGWLAAYTPMTEGEEKDSKTLPDFTEGQPLELKEMQSEQKFTKPPLRYTDSTLVKAMEENGIGRPSTYAATISVLAKRTYTDKEGKYIKPTELGEIVCDTRALAEDHRGLLSRLQGEAGRGKGRPLREGAPQRGGERRHLRKVRRAHGRQGQPKDSRYGKFLACPNFPRCRNTKPYGEPVAKCPKCGGGVYKKISKKGKAYYACENRECGFFAWDVPAPKLCPDCGAYMKMTKSKSGEVKYTCSNAECKHTEIVTGTEK